MFKSYQQYKQSGVEWLGEVPSHWGISPTKHCFELITDKLEGENSEELLSIYTDIGVKPRKELKEKGNRATTTEGYWVVKKRDLIVNKLLAWMGAIGISEYNGVTSPAYDILRARNGVNPYFYNYLFRCGIMFNEFKKNSRGVMDVRLRLYFSEFGAIKLPYPTFPEQTQIATYLDQETQKIDNLILKQEKLIELLEEQRKSIISHAVTKGIDPNAKMKDSGVEWLGEVPEHWGIHRFSSIFIENKRKNRGMLSDNLLSLSYGKIIEKDIHNVKGLVPENFETYQIIYPNDIVFRFTDLQNDKRSLRSAISKFKGIITSAYISVSSKTDNLDMNYYAYLFRTYDLMKVFYSMGDGMRQSLKMSELNRMLILVPEKSEQQQIVNFIETENNKIDQLIQKQTALIEKLKEYRSSIISHAVTGKIDVRHLIS
ncbi:Probable type I restriction modification system, specificity component HsdS2 [Canicola haemoglobinophilus]|uniref:Probable type I restriction modification system, specificity component HsdS2 n=1 Tax=Canicola haemoglobinophilus TaxID=733 RepID=A0AB38H5F4_9PAST|nr:restriction endonuclease subunit S [Canicola haemoglobinophilus]STO54659.1 Probable type I restriction modification system, specificity component HsdS2 [Canicola haemoglobinophilus]STO67566.1 Probable type I restriction modification system, specificity component HsdS2 [Canicola haemoglobinophilus]